MMWDWGGGMQWWGWLLGALGMVVFWGLVMWAIWYFVIAVVRRPESERRTGDAKGMLDERLAKGEIDAEEYRRLRDLMTGKADHARDGQEPVGTGIRR